MTARAGERKLQTRLITAVEERAHGSVGPRSSPARRRAAATRNFFRQHVPPIAPRDRPPALPRIRPRRADGLPSTGHTMDPAASTILIVFGAIIRAGHLSPVHPAGAVDPVDVVGRVRGAHAAVRHAAAAREPGAHRPSAHHRPQGGPAAGRRPAGGALPGRRQRGARGAGAHRGAEGGHHPQLPAGHGHRPGRPRRAGGRADVGEPQGHQHARAWRPWPRTAFSSSPSPA